MEFLRQSQESVQLAILLFEDGVAHVPEHRHYWKHRSLWPNQFGFHDISITGLATGGGTATILQCAVNRDQPPFVEQPGLIQHAHLHQPFHHGHQKLRYRTDGNPRGVLFGVFRARDGAAYTQPLCLPCLLTQLKQVFRHLAAIAVRVEGVAGAPAHQER